ncbi:MAG: hypothetical protein ACOH5I_04130 [Oligoflexus sp.]
MRFWQLTTLALLVGVIGCTKFDIRPGTAERSKDLENQSAAGNPQGAEAGEEGSKEEEKIPLLNLAITDEEALHDLKESEEQLAIVCARNAGKTNRVVQAFCVDKIRPKSLKELQAALGFNFVNVSANRNQNGAGGNPAFAVQGHSSSLVGRFTNAINPRVIIMSPDNLGNNTTNPDFVVMGFVRGEQFVEIIVNNGPPVNGVHQLDLFLVGFKQECNSKPEHCSMGELLTPAIESNWTDFTIYEAEDLKNTIVDCLHCHQPEGAESPTILRMQELRNPWTHWFRNNTAGQELINDYYAAHGQDEEYGGIPGVMIQASDPQLLENLVRGHGFRELQIQEIEFQTGNIQNEVQNASPAQPADNTVPGSSDTWEQLYQMAATGFSSDGRTIIPIPYHDVKVTEPELLTKYTQQYQDFRAGLVSMEQFEDHREALRVDQTQRANMGYAVRPGTDPQTMLIQSCNQCHNSKLDQTISRSKFDVNLAAMGERAPAEIDIAISRLKLGYTPERRAQEGIKFQNEKGEEVELAKGEHLLTMPPRRFKDLTDEQIDTLIQYLESEKARLAPSSAN